MNIRELDLKEKIGQMLMVGLDTENVEAKLQELILKYKVGGVMLYKKNYKNYSEMVDLINYINKLNKVNKVPILIALDQEGGRVNRMPKDFENFLPANALAKKDNIEIVKQAGDVTGTFLHQAGVNVDYAPVLDIKRFNDKHAIGDRAFSEDIQKVADYGIAYMKELQKHNVISIVKHFPGHGATSVDSHFMLPKISKKIKELENEDIRPFLEAIDNGADALLVGHLLIKNITGLYPATMSRRFIVKYIRRKYKYRGLIISDDMRMKGVQLIYGQNKPVREAFKAGNDIVLFKYYNNMSVIDELYTLTEKHKIKLKNIDNSVDRILKMKEKYKINDNEVKKDLDIEKINKQITDINKICLS